MMSEVCPCGLGPNGHGTDSPGVDVRDGSGRNGTGPQDGTASVLHFLPDTEVHYAGNVDRLAARIAANQVEQLDQLSLIGYPTTFDEQTRDVVQASLRLAARKVLES